MNKFFNLLIALLDSGIFIASSPSFAMHTNQIAPAVAFGPIAIGDAAPPLYSTQNDNFNAPIQHQSWVPMFGYNPVYVRFLEKHFETADEAYKQFIQSEMEKSNKEEEEEESNKMKEQKQHEEEEQKQPTEKANKLKKKKQSRKHLMEKEESGKLLVEKEEEGRKLLGDLQPVSYTTQIVIENHCNFRIMPAIRSTDHRYYELNNPKSLFNLLNGQSLVMNVPYDIHGMDIWPRKNCNDDGTHCESGGCPGKDGNYVNCFGTQPQTPALTTVTLSLREGKNPIIGHDFYRAIPFSHEQNVHVEVIPTSKPQCPILDVTGNTHHEECDNTQDLLQHTYTVSFCPN